MEFFSKIGIDWKLLLAQIINFLVLLFLLKKFLYRPLLKILKERAKRIEEIEEKEKALIRKSQEAKEKEIEIIEFAKKKAQEILEETQEISLKEKKRILARTEAEVKKILREAQEKAAFKIEKLKAKEKELILKKAKEIVRKVLASSLTLELHHFYFKELLKELKKIDFSQIKKEEIVQVLVISAFPLEKKERQALNEFFFKKLKNPAFLTKTDPSLLAGIKILFNGYVIDGSLAKKIEEAF